MSDTEHPFVTAVRARGNDARDIRDAAHEACHALDFKVKGKWTRVAIDRAKPRRLGEQLMHEILARAVEQLVCRHYEYNCGSVEKWAHTAQMEMLKIDRITLPASSDFAAVVKEYMEGLRANMMARRVIALATGEQEEAA